MKGKKLRQMGFKAHMGIDTSSLPKGASIVKVEPKSTIKSYKVIAK